MALLAANSSLSYCCSRPEKQKRVLAAALYQNPERGSHVIRHAHRDQVEEERRELFREARSQGITAYRLACRKWPLIHTRPDWVNLLERPDEESRLKPACSKASQPVVQPVPITSFDRAFKLGALPTAPLSSPFAAFAAQASSQPVASAQSGIRPALVHRSGLYRESSPGCYITAFRASPGAPLKRVSISTRDQVIPVGSDFDSSRE